jgi:hypothetical protein
MTDVTVQNFGSDNIQIDTPIVSIFERVVSYGSGGWNFSILASDTSAGTSCTFTSCWAHDGADNGWNIDHLVYSSFVSCASDINGGEGYNINNCQSIAFYSCGAEANTGNPYKVTGASYNISSVSCWCFHNTTIGFYVTGDSQTVSIMGFHENTPEGASASIQVDAGCTATLIGYFVVTDVNLAAGTTNIVNDGSGNAAIADTLTVGNSVAVAGSVLAYASGETALFKATDSDNSGFTTLSQIASGNGTLESTSAISIVADDGSNAILSATTPQLLVQHLGGSYHNITLGHDDTDGHIGTNAGSLYLAPNSELVLPASNLTYGLGSDSDYWYSAYIQTVSFNNDASLTGTTDGELQVTGVFMPVQAATVDAPSYVAGGMYYDTTASKLYIGGLSGWEQVTSI